MNQNVVEKLPSLVKISIFFQKAYKSAFLVRFVLAHLPLEVVVVEFP